MLELFKGMLIMSAIGSILTVILAALRPITERIFSGSWHYNAQKIVMFSFLIPIITILSLNFNTTINRKIEPISTGYINNEGREAASSDISKENKELIIEENSSRLEEDMKYNDQINFNVDKVISISLVNNIIKIWTIGIAISLLWYIGCYLKFKYELKKNIEAVKEDSELYTIFKRCKEKVGINKKVDIYLKDDIKTPLVIGFFKNKVLVPKDILIYENISDILNHELTHIERKDLLIKLIMTLASIVHWFNPFIYILRNKVDMYCELSCDEKITMYMSYEDRKKYGESIIRIAESFIGGRQFSNTFGGNKNYIKRRLIMILNSKKQKRVMGIISAGVLCGVLLGSGYITKAVSNKVEKNVSLSSADDNGEGVNNTENNENEYVVDNNGSEVSAIDVSEEKSEDKKNEEEANKNNTSVSDGNIIDENEEAKKNDEVIDNKIKTSTESKVKEEAKNIDANKAKNVVKTTNNNSNIYVNKKYGFSLQFLESWNGNYRLEETDRGICVYMADKYLEGESGLLFEIIEVNPNDPDEGNFIDGIYGVPKMATINGRSFWVGAQTGITVSDTNKNFNEYLKMTKECPQILKTLKTA